MGTAPRDTDLLRLLHELLAAVARALGMNAVPLPADALAILWRVLAPAPVPRRRLGVAATDDGLLIIAHPGHRVFPLAEPVLAARPAGPAAAVPVVAMLVAASTRVLGGVPALKEGLHVHVLGEQAPVRVRVGVVGAPHYQQDVGRVPLHHGQLHATALEVE